MFFDWRFKLLMLGLLTGFYFMFTCLITVTRLDAEKLEKRQVMLEDLIHMHNTHLTGSLNGMVLASKKALRRTGNRIQWCHTLGLKAAPGPVVAVASFPGSGNTWLRYLLQQATGILTGSMYKDFALLKNGFAGESISNGSVIAVKTHEWGPTAREPFEKAILLVRDPFSSILAEYNRRSGGHIGHASVEKFRVEGGAKWRQFVVRKGQDWETMNLDWAFNFTGPKLVIFYNELCDNTEEIIRKILTFLQLAISNQSMSCLIKNKEGIYRRPKKARQKNVLSEDLREYLQQKQDRVYSALKSLS